MKQQAPILARGTGWTALAVAVVAVVALCGVWVTQPAHGAPADRHVIVGSTDAHRLSGYVTPTPANHTYERLTDGRGVDVSARYINLEADLPGQWAAIAAGRYDTAILRVANKLDNTGRMRLVAFNHEPSTEVGTAGSPADYRRAFRHFTALMRRYAPRVRTVWAVTQISLVADSAMTYYPGSAAVDYVSSNAFNRAGCASKSERWTSFGSKVQPLIELARDVGKPVVISEWGMTNRPERPDWIRNATRYVETHPRIAAMFYYNTPWNDTCEWELVTGRDYAAMTDQIARLR